MKLYLILILLLSSIQFFGQEDSLSISSELGIRGRWQTGNLNQLAINPNALISFSKKSSLLEFRADYHYLEVNDFLVQNDFWSYGFYQHKTDNRFFPMATVRYGTSRSYQIDYSVIAGGGLGVNIRNKNSQDFIRVSGFAGYLDFKFKGDENLSSPVGGLLLKVQSPIAPRMSFMWDLQSFHPTSNSKFWGFNNTININYKVLKNLALNATHSLIFNNQTAANIEKTNGLMLFGISYKMNNQIIKKSNDELENY